MFAKGIVVLQVVEDERYVFTSSLLGLLAEYSIWPHVINASAISNCVKVLTKQLMEICAWPVGNLSVDHPFQVLKYVFETATHSWDDLPFDLSLLPKANNKEHINAPCWLLVPRSYLYCSVQMIFHTLVIVIWAWHQPHEWLWCL